MDITKDPKKYERGSGAPQGKETGGKSLEGKGLGGWDPRFRKSLLTRRSSLGSRDPLMPGFSEL